MENTALSKYVFAIIFTFPRKTALKILSAENCHVQCSPCKFANYHIFYYFPNSTNAKALVVIFNGWSTS